MRVDKAALKHAFDWCGDRVELTINTNFTNPQYDAFQKYIDEKFGDNMRVEALGELAEFYVKAWNLEDEDGAIKPVAEEIITRVPLTLLVQIVKEASDLINSGGVPKNA